MDWLRNEYRRFKESRTIRLAYAQKALGFVTLALELLPFTQGYMTPAVYGIVMVLFGHLSKQLRMATSKVLD